MEKIPPDLDHVVIAPELLIKNKTTNHSAVHILSLAHYSSFPSSRSTAMLETTIFI